MEKKIHIDGLNFDIYMHGNVLLSYDAEVAIYNALHSQEARYQNSRIKEYLHGCLCVDFWNEREEAEFLDNYKMRQNLLYAFIQEDEDEGTILCCVYGDWIHGDNMEICTYKIDEPIEELAVFDPYHEVIPEDDSWEDDCSYGAE
jgi:hypothetical protein